jgi:hypothetical protein
MKKQFFLIPILFLALILRLYGINWDQGFHLHPDERMLIMVATRIHFFDQLNPNFFNYGSLPIYLLRGLSQLVDWLFDTSLSNYQGMLYFGRFLSIFFDLITIFLIYKIAQLIEVNLERKNKDSNVKQPQGLLKLISPIFYAIAFFPIQNSHFFISDVFLTTFTTLLIFLLLKNLKEKNKPRLTAFLIGLVFAAMTATKFTAVIFYPIIILFFIFYIFLEKNLSKKKILNFLFLIFIFNFYFLFFNFIFMPYAFLDAKKFITDVSLQAQMNSNPYIFPYTLQYVGSIPYLYYLKNIFLWGLGPVISVLSFIGLICFFVDILKTVKFYRLKFINKLPPKKNKKETQLQKVASFFLFFIFYILYFLIIGRSAVKFMRYMLPIYPFLVIMAGYGIKKISNFQFLIFKPLKKFNHQLFTLFFILSSFIWTLMFINIYSQKHTRISATEWILKNISPGSTLAVEHWDDRLPLFGGENYHFEELQLYNLPDDDIKWTFINQQLVKANYIIIASNRLYIPLQKLANCQKYKLCYPKTALYYKKLFNQQLGFKKVAEFAVYPKLEIGSWKLKINDQSADESFTVYDHPKVIVFKKTE